MGTLPLRGQVARRIPAGFIMGTLPLRGQVAQRIPAGFIMGTLPLRGQGKKKATDRVDTVAGEVYEMDQFNSTLPRPTAQYAANGHAP